MIPRIAVVMGTRPEVIKLSPVVARLNAATWCSVRVVLSGQQADLVPLALAGCGYDAPEPASRAVRCSDPTALVDLLAEHMQPMIEQARPDLLIVQGDTATALAGARAARRLAITVAHVEAGLRTYDLSHPYPEELFRQAIARIARLHFAPTASSRQNLLRENIPPSWVRVTGNTIVDAMRAAPTPRCVPQMRPPFAIVTLHRRELAPHLRQVLQGLHTTLAENPALSMIIPAHPNPLITSALRAALATHEKVCFVDPLPHREFLGLLMQAALVMTDSGGVQEEAGTLGIPLVIIRKVTERTDILRNGRSIVAGFEPSAIASAVAWALALPPGHAQNTIFGDGRAARRIEYHLRTFLAPASKA